MWVEFFYHNFAAMQLSLKSHRDDIMRFEHYKKDFFIGLR